MGWTFIDHSTLSQALWVPPTYVCSKLYLASNWLALIIHMDKETTELKLHYAGGPVLTNNCKLEIKLRTHLLQSQSMLLVRLCKTYTQVHINMQFLGYTILYKKWLVQSNACMHILPIHRETEVERTNWRASLVRTFRKHCTTLWWWGCVHYWPMDCFTRPLLHWDCGVDVLVPNQRGPSVHGFLSEVNLQ